MPTTDRRRMRRHMATLHKATGNSPHRQSKNIGWTYTKKTDKVVDHQNVTGEITSSWRP